MGGLRRPCFGRGSSRSLTCVLPNGDRGQCRVDLWHSLDTVCYALKRRGEKQTQIVLWGQAIATANREKTNTTNPSIMYIDIHADIVYCMYRHIST